MLPDIRPRKYSPPRNKSLHIHDRHIRIERVTHTKTCTLSFLAIPAVNQRCQCLSEAVSARIISSASFHSTYATSAQSKATAQLSGPVH